MRKNLFREALGKVLEVAAGTGNNLRHYPKDCKITLVDLSRGMLKRASQKAGKQKLHVSIQEMDAESLGFSDNAFDTVVDSLSVCTLKQPVEALKEMARVCKPSGRIPSTRARKKHQSASGTMAGQESQTSMPNALGVTGIEIFSDS